MYRTNHPIKTHWPISPAGTWTSPRSRSPWWGTPRPRPDGDTGRTMSRRVSASLWGCWPATTWAPPSPPPLPWAPGRGSSPPSPWHESLPPGNSHAGREGLGQLGLLIGLLEDLCMVWSQTYCTNTFRKADTSRRIKVILGLRPVKRLSHRCSVNGILKKSIEEEEKENKSWFERAGPL